MCPFIDVIDAQDYEYRAQDEGNRGAFEWNFLYKRIDIRPGDQETPADNFPSPIMAGGLFAMSAKFFWEVGGYDPGKFTIIYVWLFNNNRFVSLH